MNKYNIECFTKMCQENWHTRKCNNNVVKPPLLVTFKKNQSALPWYSVDSLVWRLKREHEQLI